MNPATRCIASTLLASALLLASGVAPAGAGLDLRGALGYDSNPFLLNEQVASRGGAFADAQATLEATRESPAYELGFDAGASALRFGSSMDDADETRLYARVRGETPRKKPGHGFDWALRYRLSDTTYVSRFTAQPATSGGQSIADRYDAGIADLRAAWRLPQGDAGRFSVQGEVESKDYRKDYAVLGLDRLDYLQLGVEPRYELERGRHQVKVALPLALRRYRDRRVSDAAGAPIAGSDLEYRYYGIDAGYGYELSRDADLEATAGYEIRTDNGVGYRDRKRWNAGLEWKYRLGKDQRLAAGAEWYSRVFDRPVLGDPTVVDETPEKDGYTLRARYTAPILARRVENLSAFASAQWESFDNSNDFHYSYDRLEALAGVRKEF